MRKACFAFASIAVALMAQQASAQLIISGICYDPNSSEDDWEFVEVHNTTATDVDMTGWVVDDSNSTAHTSANIAGGTVPANGYAYLINADKITAAGFIAAWGNCITIEVTDWAAMGLGNSGDTVGLWSDFASYDGDNATQANVVDTVTYAEGTPWPASTPGSAIYLDDVTADNSLAASWLSANGTAGTNRTNGAGTTKQSVAAGGNGGTDYAMIVNIASTDDPDISVATAAVYFSRVLSSGTDNKDLPIGNLGTAISLNVSGSTLGGTNASDFGIVSEPTVLPGGTGNMTLQFAPTGGDGVYTAAVTINSDDTSGDIVTVDLYGVVADMSPYAGLYITEVASQPSEDEFVEVTNTAASAIDISGVVISDDDNNNTEGALKFPAATTIAAGETILLAMNNSATEPTWLDSLTPGVRVFVEAARDTNAWAAANGNSIIAMDDYTDLTGGCTDVIALSGADGVALYHPLLAFVAGRGPQFPDLCIDGMNYDSTDNGPNTPINTTGTADIQATRAGVDQPAAGNSFQRAYPAAVNTDSSAAFSEAVITPGIFAPTGVDMWLILGQ